MSNIAVIGAGPAGSMASYEAGKNNSVTLFDGNEKIGKKLFLTGKGRCNFTNDRDISEFFDNVIRNREFLYSSLYSFTNESLKDLFKSYSLNYKVERRERVFPMSDKSSDVLKTLEKMIRDSNVRLCLNERVKSIEKTEIGFKIVTNKQTSNFDKVIISTGGLSYPSTGSTGDGYRFARSLGHSVIEPKAALIPIICKDDFIRNLQGLSLKNVSLHIETGRGKYSDFGEMMFTSNGITGPIALSLSSRINREEIKAISIDLKPALTFDELDSRIISDFTKYSNKNLINALNDLLPKSLIPVIIKLANLDPRCTVHQVNKQSRLRLVENIKKMPLNFKELFSIEAAIITSGGIDTKEINPSTMESKLVNGLYFCGEVLDVDALTGGYNLQIAFSTGYLAGLNAGE